MKRSLIAIAALLASVSASGGELDGTGLICHSGTKPVLGWEFQDGRAIGMYVEKMGAFDPKAEVVRGDIGEYVTSTDQVRWPPMWILDRETLRLGGENQRDNSMGPKGTMMWILQCEVATSLDIVRATLEAQAEKQRQIDEQMKDNKI